MCKSITL